MRRLIATLAVFALIGAAGVATYIPTTPAFTSCYGPNC